MPWNLLLSSDRTLVWDKSHGAARLASACGCFFHSHGNLLALARTVRLYLSSVRACTEQFMWE